MLDAAAVNTSGTDEWWLTRLLGQLDAKPVRKSSRVWDSRRCDYKRTEWMDVLWAYHTGEPPLTDIARQWADATRQFLRMAKTGYAGLIATALLERVKCTGVRVVGSDGEPDVDGDDDVRRILAVNAAAISDALEYAAVMGEGYVSVSAGGPAGVLLAAEDPRTTIASVDPVTGTLRAVLKLYRDEDREESVAALYVLDDESAGMAHQATFVRSGVMAGDTLAFTSDWCRADSSYDVQLVPGQGIPFVRFQNPRGIGEVEPHLDLIDRIYSGIADRLWAVKYQVFMQRAIKGDLPDVDEDGRDIDYDSVFAADPGALWRLPEGVDIWESKQITISEVLAPVKDDLRELAAVSKTPLPTLMSESVNGSAEGATLAREGLSFKAEDRIERWSPGMVQVARLALAYAGKGVPAEMEPMWAPVERLSLAQRTAAARDAATAGVPREAIWADIMQMPPATVKRWQALYDMEQLFAEATPTAQSTTTAAPTADQSITQGAVQ